MKRLASAISKELKYALNRIIYPSALALDWDNTLNFGDRISPFILSKLTSRKIIHAQSRYRRRFACIGSILDRTFVANSVVWGSGFISYSSYPRSAKLNIKAVRGPLTKHIFDAYSVNCPPVFGDPSIFLADLLPCTNKKKSYTLGLIPHYAECFNFLKSLVSKSRYASDILLININDHPLNVINMINNCSYIASSSLHGCIMADIYQIPCCHIVISNNVIGGNFKFDDYRYGLDSNPFYHLNLADKGFDLDALISKIENATSVATEKIESAKMQLIKSFPFPDLIDSFKTKHDLRMRTQS